MSQVKLARRAGTSQAVAYWTENPRGTSDIDVNVFLDSSECEAGLRALPPEVRWSEDDARLARLAEAVRRGASS